MEPAPIACISATPFSLITPAKAPAIELGLDFAAILKTSITYESSFGYIPEKKNYSFLVRSESVFVLAGIVGSRFSVFYLVVGKKKDVNRGVLSLLFLYITTKIAKIQS